MIPSILGWDIGGVNTKAARLGTSSGASACQTICLPFELQREPSALGSVLRSAARQLRGGARDRHAITMTAELSQTFRTKREGVAFVLDALESVFPPDRLHVYTVTGRFVTPRQARAEPLEVAASNWAATAEWLARLIPTAILIDIGTTTTDLIPILQGRVAAQGRTDPERLRARELVYTGVLRTPVEAVSSRVPLWGGTAGVAAEGFALMGDVHLWLGRITTDDYTCSTPDGRPASRTYARERLARVVCADYEMLDDAAIDGIARAFARSQLDTIVEALRDLRRRSPEIDTAVVTGVGGPIGADAAGEAGLKVIALADQLGNGALTAPAVAVAWLLRDNLAAD